MPRREPENKVFLLKNMPRGRGLSALAEAYPQADLPAMEAYGAMMETASEILCAVNRALHREGISQARFRLLLVLRRSGQEGIHPMDLAEILGVERATVTGLLKGVERAGLALRRPCREDRRAVVVALTAKGRRLIDSVAPGRLARISALMGGLSAPEKKEFTRLLDAVRERIPEFRKI